MMIISRLYNYQNVRHYKIFSIYTKYFIVPFILPKDSESIV